MSSSAVSWSQRRRLGGLLRGLRQWPPGGHLVRLAGLRQWPPGGHQVCLAGLRQWPGGGHLVRLAGLLMVEQRRPLGPVGRLPRNQGLERLPLGDGDLARVPAAAALQL